MKVYEFFKPDGSNWTQGVCARNSEGERTDMAGGTKFCLMAAVEKVYGEVGYIPQSKVLYARLGAPFSWNDTEGRTVEEVISLCKELDI